MKKVITLIALSAIFVSPCFAQVSAQPSQFNYTSFTTDKANITKELESATASQFKTHPEYGVLPFNAPCKDCYEVLQNRDEHHRYFLKEGSEGKEFYAQTSYGNLNYKDASGLMRTIDYRLKPTVKDGIYSASQQQYPVTVNLHDKYVSIINGGKELQVNRNISLFIKKADGTLISMGEPSWADYTAGNDGVVVHNIYPGIDLEMQVGEGHVESFYRLNKPLNLEGASLVIHDNMQLPGDFVFDYSYAEKTPVDNQYGGALCINSKSGLHYFIIANPAVVDENGTANDHVKGLNFSVDNNGGYDLFIPIDWMNSPARSYPIVIDPYVTATDTLPISSITGSGYNATCFANGCTYNLNLTVPAACHVTDILYSFNYSALGSCNLNQGAWDLTSGSCRSPITAGTWHTCTIGLPGLCILQNLSCYSEVQACIPAPQCPAYNMPFVLTFYRCVSPGTGCGFSCITANTPWDMTVKGYTGNAYTSSTSICQGAKANLTATTDSGVGTPTFKWYPGSISGNPVTVSPSTNTTYTVTASWCQGLDTAQAVSVVTVAPNDNPGFTISPNPACPGGAVSITGLGSRPLTSYDWTIQGGSPSVKNDTKSFTATFASPGTYNITLIDSSNECVFDSTLTIVVANNVATAGPDTSVCSGSKVQLIATGGSSYSWLPTAGLDNPAIANPVASPSVTTTYTVTATSGSCSATATVTVTIKQGITVSITPNGPTTFCQGGSVQLTANGGSTYVWSTTSTTNPITASTTGTYSVVGTDVNGCTGSSSTSVLVNPLPTVTASANGNTAICEGGSVQICANQSFSGYKWNNGASSSCISAQNPGTYSVTVTDNNGCTGTSNTVTVTVALPPTVIITAGGPTSFCQGGSVVLTASGATSYVWSTTATTNPITASATGTYSVVGTDASGCSGTASQSVTVNPNPTVVITANGPTTFCQGDSVILTASGANTYIWNPTNETTGSIVVRDSGAFFAVGTDVNGCTGTSNTINVTVQPKATVTINPIAPVCLTSPAVTLTGSPAGGTFSGPGVVGNTFDPSLTGIGTFTITYTYVAQGFCITSSTATTQVTVSPQAIVNITISQTIGCLNHTIYNGYGPQDVTLTANSNSVITSYQWYDNGSAIPGATNKTLVTSSAGSYNVIVTVPGGCPSDTANTLPMHVNVLDIRCGEHNQKLVLCHVPDCQYPKEVTLCIGPSAVPAHLRNHPCDCLGPCDSTKHKTHPWLRTEGEGNSETSLENDEDMLMSSYPNPFSSVTTIQFERLSEDAHILVEVYTLTGDKVATLFDKDAEAGVEYKVQLDGSTLAAGVYIYRISGGEKVVNGKLILIK